MVNDTTIFYSLTLFFVIIGVVMPYMNDSFGTSQGEFDPERLTEGIDTSKQVDAVDALDLVLSIVSMFFWSFGVIPVFAEIIIFVPLRVTWIFMLVKILRGTS